VARIDLARRTQDKDDFEPHILKGIIRREEQCAATYHRGENPMFNSDSGGFADKLGGWEHA